MDLEERPAVHRQAIAIEVADPYHPGNGVVVVEAASVR